jgi:hypothetical protein
MLIEHKEDSSGIPAYERFPSPVSGDINDNIPTSGDVHLYSDPASYYSAMPMLYADCEGLDGGENVPRGARYRQREVITATTSPVIDHPFLSSVLHSQLIRNPLIAASVIFRGPIHLRRGKENTPLCNCTRDFCTHFQT